MMVIGLLYPAMSFGDNSFTAVLFKVLTLLVGSIGFALCFFGYKLQRIYIALVASLISGGVCAAVGAMVRTNDSVFIVVLLGLLGLALGAVIGYKWFKSIFTLVYALLGFFTTYFIIYIFDHEREFSATGIILGVIVAVGMAFLVHKFYKPFVIIVSSLQGSALCVNGFSMMIQYDGFVDFSMQMMGGMANAMLGGLMGETSRASGNGKAVFVVLLLALGIFFQWKTAGSKISDFFHSLATGNGQASDNAPFSAAANDKYLSYLYRPLTLPNVKNINLFLAGGAVCAVASLLRGGNFIMLLGTLSMAAAIALLLLQKRGMGIPSLAVNLSFLISFVLYVIVLIQVLANGAYIFSMLTPVAAAIFLGGFWFMATQQTHKVIPFLISGGLAAAQLILAMINGAFGLLDLSIILLNLPLILPALQQYTAALPAQAERLNNAIITPQSSVEASAPAQPKANTDAQPKAGTVFCTQCGSALRANAVFCTKCGTKVDSDT